MWISERNTPLIAYIWGKKQSAALFNSKHSLICWNHPHPSPSRAPHYRTNLHVTAPYGYLYQQRELMDEFQMCVPGVWGDVSICRLEENAPPLGVKYPRCPCSSFHSITSPQTAAVTAAAFSSHSACSKVHYTQYLWAKARLSFDNTPPAGGVT